MLNYLAIIALLILGSGTATAERKGSPVIANTLDTCLEVLDLDPIEPAKPAPISEIEKVRAELRKVEPMLTPVGKGIKIDWKGIEDQIRLRSKNMGEPLSRLEDLNISVWERGVETHRNLMWGTSSLTLPKIPNGQTDYYVEYKRGQTVLHRSSFGLKETKEGQQLAQGSFDRRYSGELFGVNYDPELTANMPSPELTDSAVRLSYNKIVWVIKPTATAQTRKFIENAEEGVDVHALFGADGTPTHVSILDRKTQAKTVAPANDFFFKLDAAFSGHAFFWDDMIVALATVPHHPWLVRSTIEFWLMVQERHGGVIPREVRKSNLLSLFFSDQILYGDKEAKANLVYTNPNLMSWVMEELYRHDPKGNLDLLKRVSKSIEDYTQWMEANRAVKYGNRIIGFNGSALGTGADNSRGRIGNRNEPEAYKSGLIDFMAQQIQMYKDIARWSRMLVELERNTLSPSERMRLLSKAATASAKAVEYRQVMNHMYWNKERCFYYDIIPDGDGGWKHNLDFTVVGGFWTLWAGVPDRDQLNCMIEKQMTPQGFGGDLPFPANARYSIGKFKDPLYVPRPGNQEDGYWDKWAHWPPMVMMAIEGFRRMGRADLAYEYALNFLKKTAAWSTKTVEESLGEIMTELPDGSVTFEARAIQHAEHMHREDFAGWGKGPPVYLLLKHIIGLLPNYNGKMTWNLMIPLKLGQFIEVKNLQYMGHSVRSLKVRRIGVGALEVTVDSDGAFDIEVNVMRDSDGRLHNSPINKTPTISVPAGGTVWKGALR